MAAISRAQLLRELLPGLDALFGMEYNRYENEYAEIYTEHSSERSFEQDQKITGFQTAPVKQEGSAILFDTAQEGYTATFVMETISMGFALTEEAFEDNLYGNLSARYSTELGRAMRNTKEIKAAVPFNTGFTAVASGGYGVGDGVQLFSTAHPQVAGPTIANRPSVAVDLNETSLEAATIQIAKWTDDRGKLIEARVGHLDDADVGFDGAEGIVLRRDAGLGQCVEEGGLADVGQAHDAAFEAHGELSWILRTIRDFKGCAWSNFSP